MPCLTKLLVRARARRNPCGDAAREPITDTRRPRRSRSRLPARNRWDGAYFDSTSFRAPMISAGVTVIEPTARISSSQSRHFTLSLWSEANRGAAALAVLYNHRASNDLLIRPERGPISWSIPVGAYRLELSRVRVGVRRSRAVYQERGVQACFELLSNAIVATSNSTPLCGGTERPAISRKRNCRRFWRTPYLVATRMGGDEELLLSSAPFSEPSALLAAQIQGGC
jgi:hypothetical protein